MAAQWTQLDEEQVVIAPSSHVTSIQRIERKWILAAAGATMVGLMCIMGSRQTPTQAEVSFATFLAEGDFQEEFKAFDVDGNGGITAAEIVKVMWTVYGQKVSEAEVAGSMRMADVDKNGELNYAEFMVMVGEGKSAGTDPVDPVEGHLEKMFRLFDKDQNGFVNAKEILEVTFEMDGEKLTDEAAAESIRKGDKNGDGQLDYMEFLTMMSEHVGPESVDEHLEELFKMFDKDGDSFVSAAELREATYAMVGQKLTDAEAAKSIREADADKDGRVSFDEFVKMRMHE